MSETPTRDGLSSSCGEGLSLTISPEVKGSQKGKGQKIKSKKIRKAKSRPELSNVGTYPPTPSKEKNLLEKRKTISPQKKKNQTTDEESEKSTDSGMSLKSPKLGKMEKLMLKEDKRPKSTLVRAREYLEENGDNTSTSEPININDESPLGKSKSRTKRKLKKLDSRSKIKGKDEKEEDKEPSPKVSVNGRDSKSEKSSSLKGTSMLDVHRHSEDDSDKDISDTTPKRKLPRDRSRAKIKNDSEKKRDTCDEKEKSDTKLDTPEEEKKDIISHSEVHQEDPNEDHEETEEEEQDFIKTKTNDEEENFFIKFPNGEIGSMTWAPDLVMKEVISQLSLEKGIPEIYSVLTLHGHCVDIEKTLGELDIYHVVLTDEPPPPNYTPTDPEEFKKRLKKVKRIKHMSLKKTPVEEEEKLQKREKRATNAISSITTKAKFSVEVMDSCPQEGKTRINFRESILFNNLVTTRGTFMTEAIQKPTADERRKLYTTPPLDDPVLQRSTVDKIKRKVLGRINVAFELLDKEQDYLRYLCMLLLTFKKPMLENQNKLNLTEEQIHVAYGNIEDIIPLHQELLDLLLAKFDQWTENQTLGDTFNLWLPAVIEPYKVYAINYHDCLIVWEDIKDKPGVKNFLEGTYAKTTTTAGQLDVGAFLIKPIQRITRDYTMIFERLIKITPDSHPDHKQLNQVMDELKLITLEINSATHDPADLKYFAQNEQEEQYSPRSIGGYIYKKGANVRNWKYRFMKIELDTKELVYYKADNKKEKKGSIPLTAILDVKPATYRDKGGTERKNLFIIVTTDRTFFIQPHNQVQRLRWIEAIDFYRRVSTEQVGGIPEI